MKTRALFMLFVFVSGCTTIDTNTRTERGPLLRSFERPVLMPGGITADVRADWPLLKLTVVGYDVCRAQQVDEYAEDVVTERTSNAAGPSLSTGIVGVLASAVLFGVSFAVSSAPDQQIIDAGGRYGPSTQQYLRGASAITLGVGVPAVIVGLVAKLRSGDEVETRRAEQIVSQKDARCNERPENGPFALKSAQGGHVPLEVVDGALDIDGDKMPVVPESMHFAERDVELTEDGQAVFASWAACVALKLESAKSLDALSESGLLSRAERLRECRRIRGDSIAAEVKATDDELSRRRVSGSPAAWAPGTNVSSFEEAVSAYAPTVKLAVGSKDLGVLDTPEAHEGRAVLVQGIVGEGLTENIGVIQVGERELFLFIPPKKAWGGQFPAGTRIEAVALVSGRQTLGEKNLPLLRAVWMRTAW
ncbi:MAG: hypothetical protein DI536_33925 [Archangium gephyra]|uniref:Lipoprotein n=1 Tax=Archangium gephyra TaxID=48 RepID=A0A2W5SZ66_9BACT|nr:MAG: hypothetical protein DI536_33925 [Archangium gephyra]